MLVEWNSEHCHLRHFFTYSNTFPEKIVCNVCADVGECSDCCFGRWTVVLLALSVVVLLVAVAVELLVPVAVVLLTSAAVALLVLSAVDC